MKHKIILSSFLLMGLAASAVTNHFGVGSMMQESPANDSVKVEKNAIENPHYLDEVVWVVGDEPILRSDIEVMRMQGEQEGVDFGGDPDCRIPEQLAVQKLFLHQAAIDSIEVTEAEVSNAIEQQLNGWIQMAGSRERLEEYRKQTITQMKNELHDELLLMSRCRLLMSATISRDSQRIASHSCQPRSRCRL